jgi:hypothetical protein
VKKRTAKAKKIPPKVANLANSEKDQAWFEQKVAELGARLNRLPAARQEQLEQDLAKRGRR